MPRGRKRKQLLSTPMPPDEQPATAAVSLPEDDFLSSLRTDIVQARKQLATKNVEDPSRRAALNRRLLQDFWEVHNLFEDLSVHLTMEPAQTLFATFTEFPYHWAFKESFDFAAVKAVELKDRTPGWLGSALKAWYYLDPEGKTHLRVIFEWCEGETYHKYTGWMRVMTQAVLMDTSIEEASVQTIHHLLKDVVLVWYKSHLKKDPQELYRHLKESYPKGATEAKESYRT